MYLYYIHTSRVDKFYDIIHLLVHRARQAPDKLQHWLAAGEHIPRPASRQSGESSVEQGHHGHRQRTTDGAIRGFHGDGGWTEGAREEPDEVRVFCCYTGKYAGVPVAKILLNMNECIIKPETAYVMLAFASNNYVGCCNTHGFAKFNACCKTIQLKLILQFTIHCSMHCAERFCII